jgi:transglutaminase-like putative cysteine protease
VSAHVTPGVNPPVGSGVGSAVSWGWDAVSATLTRSLLAGLATFVTLLSWAGFAEQPAGYLVPLFAACLMVAVVGTLLRAARVPPVLVALGQLLVLGLWLHHRLASGPALGGWLPSGESLRHALHAVHAAGVAAQVYSSPVPASAPQFYPLLILTGALTAVLVDLLAVGLRRAPLAGLPLLAAYTAPVSILDGVSWVAFAAAALCFLALVAADHAERLEHWGRRLSPRRAPWDVGRERGGGTWSSARRIGLTATALAVVVPLLVPTLNVRLFPGTGGPGNGPGGSVSLSNPMVDLKRDLVRGADVDLVTLTTADPDPSYLRLTVLDNFDGSAWRPSTRTIPRKQRADGQSLSPPGLGSSVRRQPQLARIRVSRLFRSRWLPTPYPVTSVDAPGDWRYDTGTLDFLSAASGQTAAGLSYRTHYLQITPTAAQLNDAGAAPLDVFTPNTALPRDFPGSVRRLAERVTRGRSSKFEQAVALQDWFRVGGGFRYSLRRASGNGTDDLVSFLRRGPHGRVGYCEQFAAAMAAMGRALGIPSRVAVGFLRPERDTATDTWTYSSHDLHAWPEMYFGGVGWVRFEPTPQDRSGSVPSYTDQQLPQTLPAVPSSGPTSPVLPSRAAQPHRELGASGRSHAATTSSGRPGPLAGLVLLLLAAVVALTPRGLRSLARRRLRAGGDPASWVEAGWRELHDTAVDLAVPWDVRLTVRGLARTLIGAFGRPGEPDVASGRGVRGRAAPPRDAVAALDRLVDLLERARYARSLPVGATTADGVRALVTTCEAALRAGAGRRRRVRARWLPASLLPASRTRTARHGRSGRDRRGPAVDPALDPAVDRAV